MSADERRHVTLLDDGPDLVSGSVPGSIEGASFLDALSEPGRTHRHLTATRSAGVSGSYRRGRGVGGSSLVNAMLGVRGDPDLYRSWGWRDVDDAWRRVALPLETPDPDELGAVDRALLAADRRAVVAELTRRGGRRVTSAEAYVWPALDRPTLTVRANSEVERVVLDGRRACGVQLVDGTHIDADVVVMAAGAIHTPAILLRSGVATVGVGQGLLDHPSVPLTLALRDLDVDVHSLVVGSLLHDGPVQVLPMNHLGPDEAGFGVLMVALMRPVSPGGHVTLGADPTRRDPDVDFAMLTDRRDVEQLRRGVRLALAMLEHQGFRDVVEQVYVDAHGTTSETLTDDDTIDSWIRANCGDYVHASSSCAIGRVADQDGFVVGHDGLAICDASAFPGIPDANTHLPTTMLAERLCARWLARGRMTR